MPSIDLNEAISIKPRGRLNTIDVLRGLVIVIMVLDHVRDYTHVSGFAFDPLDFHETSPLLYATRWITHLCAPTFVFLAGVSIWLQHAKGKTGGDLARFLLLRGVWLIILEITIVGFGWSFTVPMFVLLGIMWAIGWSMIAMAALIFLPRHAVLAVGLAIIIGHDLLDWIHADRLGSFALLWNFLFEVRVFMTDGQPAGVILYPVLPWIGIMALGFGMGATFQSPQRNGRLLVAGVAMLLCFFLLRGANLYGDPRPWAMQTNAVSTIMDFLNVCKYPPSLLYVCATLGVVLLLTPLLDGLPDRISRVLRTIGCVPLMAYIVHLYIMHGVSILAHLMAGRDIAGQFNMHRYAFGDLGPLPGSGLPLSITYLCWAITLLLLYPICAWWAHIKQNRKDWWLSYL